jgi:hypothetical protein
MLKYNIKNTEILIDDSKKVDLEVNAKKHKYMLLFRHQNAGQNHCVKMANRAFENMAQFKHFGIFSFHKMLRISLAAVQMAVSR